MVRGAGTLQFNSCQWGKKKRPLLSNESWCCVRLCRQRWDGTAGYLEQSQGHWVTGVRASWHDWWKHTTRHTSMHTWLTDTHIYTHTHKVWLKNMIKNTVELITFPAISMSTHAEHLCPPPYIVLLWLILFSGMMIMISLAVKYKCKFTSILPDKPLGKRASLYSFGRRRGTVLKENTLNRRHYQFHFCHPHRLCHTLHPSVSV